MGCRESSQSSRRYIEMMNLYMYQQIWILYNMLHGHAPHCKAIGSKRDSLDPKSSQHATPCTAVQMLPRLCVYVYKCM
jgi:hypothetical protein